jgi:hypothetical protein
MARPNLKPALMKLITTIASKPTYYGRPVAPSIIHMLVLEERNDGAGIVAPAWLSVLEHGRGKRKSTQDSGLAKRIYFWMQRHNLFRSKTEAGRVSEARRMTWYINKYGNQQFRSKTFIDVYTTARNQCEADVMQRYGLAIDEVTKDII